MKKLNMISDQSCEGFFSPITFANQMFVLHLNAKLVTTV